MKEIFAPERWSPESIPSINLLHQDKEHKKIYLNFSEMFSMSVKPKGEKTSHHFYPGIRNEKSTDMNEELCSPNREPKCGSRSVLLHLRNHYKESRGRGKTNRKSYRFSAQGTKICITLNERTSPVPLSQRFLFLAPDPAQQKIPRWGYLVHWINHHRTCSFHII